MKMPIKLKCESLNFDGTGNVRLKNDIIKVSNILPLEEGNFEIINKGKKTFLELKNLISKSDKRISSPCPFYLECGGCQYLHLSYEDEIKLKQEWLGDLFKNFTNIDMRPIIKMHSPLNYRNKCQMVYKLSKTRKIVSGFYEEHSHRIVPVDKCLLHAEVANKVIKTFNDILNKNKIQPYDEKTRQGVVRHVVVRYGFNSKQIMLVIVTNGEMFPGRNNVVKDLKNSDLNITTIVQNYNVRDTSIVLGDRQRVLYGPGYIFDTIDDFKFKISPLSFYQVNSMGMTSLYKKAIEIANIKKTDVVLDTYCGVGTIGLFAAKFAKNVIGVELNQHAVMDAKENARLNQVTNIKFQCADSTKAISDCAISKAHIDLVIMDPPRSGSTKEFITSLSKLAPKKIVYISCEPTTLIRDLYELSRAGYAVKIIQGVDMFPRTFNLEVITLLELQK